VKVLDFGIAHSNAVSDGGAHTTAMATRPGLILGTPAYMSPEQARGLAVDKRTDIWAFGCVLFEMLTGDGAFAAGTASDSLARVIEREPDWSRLPPNLPESMDRLVRRCLQKDPADRYQTCAEIIPAFEAALEGKGETGQGGFLKYAIAGVAAIILIAAAVFFLRLKDDPELAKIKNINWANVSSTYAFPDCRGYTPCQEKKDLAARLSKVANWKSVHYDDPILKECMKLSACLSRQAHAASLVAVADWKTLTDPKLLLDCMSFTPCEEQYRRTVIVDPGPGTGGGSILKKSCAYVADNVDCCALSNETERNYCIQCKKKEQVTGGDCGGLYRLPK